MRRLLVAAGRCQRDPNARCKAAKRKLHVEDQHELRAPMNATTTKTPAIANRSVVQYMLKDLDLDAENPRFGDASRGADQSHIVEFIVNQFGIDDVLASLATNGYFQSEPLVVRLDGKKRPVVVEGNRRLAACLILANDPRARNLSNRRPKHISHEWTVDTQVPAIAFDKSEQTSLLPYLGVRHIVGSQQWDSYAKARWIDQVVSSGEMTLEQIEAAIGDTHSTITRMLDGYRFIRQLIDAGHFNPADSKRRGRGSNPDYPFSWVYTLLGYAPVREYLDLPPRGAAQNKSPVPKKHIRAAADVVTYMFGDANRDPTINDSRALRDLADAVVDPTKRELLAQGLSVKEIVQRSRPSTDRMATLLRECTEALTAATAIVADGSLSAEDAKPFVDSANKVRNLAAALFKSIQTTAFPSPDDE